MDKYIYLILGLLLGMFIIIYFWADKQEKIHKQIKMDQRFFSTKKLDTTMESIVKLINEKMKEVKRELTEEEKDEIIAKCCKNKYL